MKASEQMLQQDMFSIFFIILSKKKSEKKLAVLFRTRGGGAHQPLVAERSICFLTCQNFHGWKDNLLRANSQYVGC